MDFHVGHEAPQGKVQDRIPTALGRGWFACFRLCPPTEAYSDPNLTGLQVVKRILSQGCRAKFVVLMIAVQNSPVSLASVRQAMRSCRRGTTGPNWQ